jgi:hypothetical protein
MMKQNHTTQFHSFAFIFAISIAALALSASETFAEDLSVQAVVEQDQVCIGEAFAFQIKVDGDDSPAEPNVSGISTSDFDVRSIGGQTTNREAVTIINGQMNRDVHRGYIFTYQLTPKHEGTFQIPAIDVQVAGKTFKTEPIQITVGKPQENRNFKLRLLLSRNQCYAGEPVVLTVTWYISMNVREANFNLPILSNKAFTFIDPTDAPDPQKKYVQIPLVGGTVLAETGQDILNGRVYTTIHFQKILIPHQPGVFEIPQSTVSCSAVVRDPGTSRTPFDDDFFGGVRGSLKRFVTPSNTLSLTVLDLPTKNKPANFSGLVGNFTIEASAVPTNVNVGDPITLTIKLAGEDYIKPVELPPLNEQAALAKNFKIPEEMAPGKIEGNTKIFTQTLRALNADVKEIPPIELSFFDSADGTYKVARTKPIPLTVKPTKVITAQDAEGRDPTIPGRELKATSEGIAYNYDDASVLTHQEFDFSRMIRSPFWLTLAIIPVAAYITLLVIVTIYHHRSADPAGMKARRAFGTLSKNLQFCLKNRHPDAAASGDLLEAARNYLGDKLRLPAASLTWRDIEPSLVKSNVDTSLLRSLQSIFEHCEAQQYAGEGSSSESLPDLAKRLLEIARKLERSLK